MICLSEEGSYWSAYDKKVHEDGGVPFYTDDWLWDTFRATHPLRILLNPVKEQQMLTSYLRMAEQSPEGWLPTFPEVTGDTHRMNGTHTIAPFADAYVQPILRRRKPLRRSPISPGLVAQRVNSPSTSTSMATSQGYPLVRRRPTPR